MLRFQIVTVTPPGLPHPALAIAGVRAGGVGVLDLEYCSQIQPAKGSIETLAGKVKDPFGIKLNSEDSEFVAAITSQPPELLHFIVLGCTAPKALSPLVEMLHHRGLRVWLECTSLAEARSGEEAGVEAVIAKGHEAGGRVGQETTFILLQRLIKSSSLPVYAQGGIGLHTACACYAAGAAGVVLDSQLLLTLESPLPEDVRTRIVNLDGTETVVLGEELGDLYRISSRMGRAVVKELQETEERLAGKAGLPETRAAWRQALASQVGWSSPERHVLFSGQDIAFAASLAHRFETVGGILEGVRQAIAADCRAAATHRPLAEGSALALSHGTRYPIVQGPMARVSDKADFAFRISEGGALPFVAAAWMRAPELSELLKETKARLQDRVWGVGLLGFLPQDVYSEQLAVIRQYHPPFALIAGGQAHQVKQLEQEGITTYVHVPSPGLLRMFLREGLNRFVFEGRESGGHVGPLCSFVLFEEMINVLVESLASEKGQREYHVLFAGGIHDAESAAMISVMSGALVERGVRVGVQLGTAYLFSDAAVDSGAIVRMYQKVALNCDGTSLLVASPGHAERVVETPFTQAYKREKMRQSASGASPEEMRNILDRMKLGRLRIATKGVVRNPDHGNDLQAPQLIDLNEHEQREQGIYLVGQLAALREQVCTIDSIHHDISVQGNRRVSEIWRECATTLEASEEDKPSDIAIIGMACLYPGASSLQGYWQNILNRVNAIREIPPERWDWRSYYDPDPQAEDKICSKWGAFLDESPFDPAKYGLPPNSLPSIEPLQLLSLEVTAKALEDAGYSRRPFPRHRTSTIMGISGVGEVGQLYSFRSVLPQFFGDGARDIVSHFTEVLPKWTEDAFPGILMNVTAGRIANHFNLGGANCTVDAACASSLAAVYWAVRELESLSSDIVIVGSADLMQSPFTFMCFAKTQALSPRGRCQALDEGADGIVLGEGLAMMVLKRLADAERDGDRIYAVIKGVGASSDGRGKSLTAPRLEGQVLALERAYARAHLSPATVELIEAHATGTVIGDRTEIESLSCVFKKAGAPARSCAVGSVKSMIGHTKSSAGMASLMKASLSLYHKILAPTIGVDNPNPALSLSESPFYVNTEARPWLRRLPESPRRAGVSAFGFGGTNFHVVLEEYTDDFIGRLHQGSFQEWPAELIVWEKSSREELLEAIRFLEESLMQGAKPSLGDLAFTLAKDLVNNTGKTTKPRTRLAMVASSREDLQAKLGRAREALLSPQAVTLDLSGVYFADQPLGQDGKVAFLFPGQGSQYVNMLSELVIQFPEIRSLVERCDAILEGRLPRPLSSFIYPPSCFSEEDRLAVKAALAQTRVAQPAMGAMDLALFNLLRGLGIRPDMVAGHSYGELVALCVAGVFSEDDLVVLSEVRARCMEMGGGANPGAMAAVGADAETVAEGLRGIEGVWIANLNAPRQTVISGGREAVNDAIDRFSRQGLTARFIPVSCAFHSPFMAPAMDQLQNHLSTLRLHEPSLKVFSNTTARPYPDDPKEIARQMIRHLVSRVEFVQEIDAMYQDGARIFVEVGPGRVLSALVSQILAGRPHLAVSSNQAGGSGLVQLQHLLGQLMVHGVPIRLDRILKGRSLKEIDLHTSDQVPGFSPSTWMVSPVRARPLKNGSVSERSAPLQVAELRERQPEEAVPGQGRKRPAFGAPRQSEPHPVTPGGNGACDSNHSAGGAAEVMVQYQRLMQRFLQTQKNVMTRYLYGFSRETGVSICEEEKMLQERVSLETGPLSASLSESVRLPHTLPGRGITDAPETSSETAAPVAMAPDPSGQKFPSQEELTLGLLKIVSERTGYPTEMLGLDLDLEAELGVDSIKRTEIVAHFLQTIFAPESGGPPEELAELTGVNTLGGIIERVEDSLRTSRHSFTLTPAPAAPGRSYDTAVSQPAEVLPRFTLTTYLAPEPRRSLRLADERVVLITDDGRGIAPSMVDRLRQQGLKTVLLRLRGGEASSRDGYVLADISPASVGQLLETIRSEHGPVGALVHLLPLRRGPTVAELELEGWQERLQEDVFLLYQILQLVAQDIKEAAAAGGAWVVSASGLGGAFACDPQQTADFFPGQGGISGLLKTVALELPEVKVKCVDLDMKEASAALADHLLVEIEAEDEIVEVGYCRSRRQTLALQETSLLSYENNGLQLDASSIILVTGGARGISAAVTGELARKYQPTLILVGRTPSPPDQENPQTASLTEPSALKAILAEEQRRQQGQDARLPQVEAAYSRLLKEREIRTNLASFRETGARVSYFQVDVRDPVSFGGFLDQIYSRYGRLDGVIHGAGIIEDKLLQDKSWDAFDRVFGTKTESAFILSKKLKPETLKFLVLFSSVAGRFGNRGQVDYTAANEVYNKLAVYLDRKWPGRVMTLNWGPWKGAGMVAASVQRQFEERGVPLIEPASGARTFDLELHRGRKGEVEVLIGDGPWRQLAKPPAPGGNSMPELPLLQYLTTLQKTNGKLEIVRRLDPDYDLYLKDHCLDHKPVLPAAMAIELMAEAARQAYPEWQVAGLKGVRVYKGIVLDNRYCDVRILVDLPPSIDQTREAMEIAVSIKGATPTEVLYYRGTVVMGRTKPVAEAYRLPPESDFQAFGMPAGEAYRRLTFHGPRFQHIQDIRGIGEKGMITTVTGSTPQSCLAGSPSGQWIIDPVLLDCGLQLALFWGRTYLDITPLPSSFEEIQVYQPLDASGPLHCFYEVLRELGRTTVYANIYFFDQEGCLRALIREFESTGSKALNRLADSQPEGESPTSRSGVRLDG